MLIDHANCEKGRGDCFESVVSLRERKELLSALSQLPVKKLLHFEQVCEYMEKWMLRTIMCAAIALCEQFEKSVRNEEPYKLIDTLIIGALSRRVSCERFAALAPWFDEIPEMRELARYYRFLLKSESPFEDYLGLAKRYFPGTDETFLKRVDEIRACEREPHRNQRILNSGFHSGSPAAGLSVGT